MGTEKERFCFLKYDAKQTAIVTLETGDLHDRACRPIEAGQLISMNSSFIVLHMVQGLVKLLTIEAKLRERRIRGPINCRIDELQVLDMAILESDEQGGEESSSILVILNETHVGGRALSTYHIKSGKGIEEGPWRFENLELDSHRLIAVPRPRGGVLVIADESIFYYNHAKRTQCAVAMKPTRITW